MCLWYFSFCKGYSLGSSWCLHGKKIRRWGKGEGAKIPCWCVCTPTETQLWRNLAFFTVTTLAAGWVGRRLGEWQCSLRCRASIMASELLCLGCCAAKTRRRAQALVIFPQGTPQGCFPVTPGRFSWLLAEPASWHFGGCQFLRCRRLFYSVCGIRAAIRM